MAEIIATPPPGPEYNGWRNLATWNVHLYLSSEEPLYRACQAQVAALGKPDAREAECLVRRLMPNGTPDMDRGAADYALVDWAEIAEALGEF